MASGRKGFQATDSVDDFDPSKNVAKLPGNISRGYQPCMDFLNIPIGRFVPYQHKKGSDFSKTTGEAFNRLVESIRLDGMIQPIVARPIHDNLYEILVGETRWEASKAAGQTSIVARILKDCDDAKADRFYSASNLMVRSLSIRDQINGWWHYYEGILHNAKGSARKIEEELSDLSSMVEGEDGSTPITLRQIQKYHKVHSLIEPILKKVDNGELTLEAAYDLSFLKEEEQEQLIRWWRPVSAKIAKELKEISKDGRWSKEEIDSLYIITDSPVKSAYTRQFDNAMKRVRNQLRRRVAPTAIARLDDIMKNALDMYFEQHPEDRMPENGAGVQE